MPYQKPIQARAIETENKFLAALEKLLVNQSFEETSVEQIAELACSTKSAFLRRFGSKEQALIVLFEIYADEATATMQTVIAGLDPSRSIEDTFHSISSIFDDLLYKHFSANRGMNEYIKRQLESHDLTKKIFGECIEMMTKIQTLYHSDKYSIEGAKAAAQLLVSLNFHYNMRAMPAFPADSFERHKLFSELLTQAVRR